MSRPSDMPRTDQLDAARTEAWDELRFIAEWDCGAGTPGHEEGRRIIAAARRHVRDDCEVPNSCDRDIDNALDVIDPTGKSFPVAITAAWDARKANA